MDRKKNSSIIIVFFIFLILFHSFNIIGIENKSNSDFEEKNFLDDQQNLSVDLKIRKIDGNWQDEEIIEYEDTLLEFKITIETRRSYNLLTAIVSLPSVDNIPMFDYIENSESSTRPTLFFQGDDEGVFFSWAPVLNPKTITCRFQAVLSEPGLEKIVIGSAIGIIDTEGELFDEKNDSITISCLQSPYPDKPNEPAGPSDGFENTTYTFTTYTSDPYEKDLSYKFNWGDGSISDWTEPISSGSIIASSHKWDYEGYFPIRVKAKNTDGFESSWSDSHFIRISKKVKISKPTKGFYLANSKIFNLPFSIIIGKIDIIVLTPGIENVDRVEFYIDNILKDTVNDEPFKYNYNTPSFGSRNIKVIAYDSEENKYYDSINIWKIF